MRNRKVVSDIYSITQEKINQYARISGGMGAIHTDPAYAKKSYFKKTLVHGLYVLALIEKEFNLRMEHVLAKGQIEVIYLKPIVVEQEFHFEFEEKNEREWTVTVFSNKEAVLVGNISL